MSRGPGHWQRALLAAVERQGTVAVSDVVWAWAPAGDPETCRAALVAARRAARTLAECGHLRAVYLWCCTGCGRFTSKPCCDRRTHVLCVTNDPTIGGARPLRIPAWVNVAPAANEEEATITDGGPSLALIAKMFGVSEATVRRAEAG